MARQGQGRLDTDELSALVPRESYSHHCGVVIFLVRRPASVE